MKELSIAGGVAWWLTESPMLALGISLFVMIVLYIIGLLDEHFGVWKYENEYASKKLNPVFRRIDDNTSHILRCVESNGMQLCDRCRSKVITSKQEYYNCGG